jgi:hypothetical protein
VLHCCQYLGTHCKGGTFSSTTAGIPPPLVTLDNTSSRASPCPDCSPDSCASLSSHAAVFFLPTPTTFSLTTHSLIIHSVSTLLSLHTPLLPCVLPPSCLEVDLVDFFHCSRFRIQLSFFLECLYLFFIRNKLCYTIKNKWPTFRKKTAFDSDFRLLPKIASRVSAKLHQLKMASSCLASPQYLHPFAPLIVPTSFLFSIDSSTRTPGVRART